MWCWFCLALVPLVPIRFMINVVIFLVDEPLVLFNPQESGGAGRVSVGVKGSSGQDLHLQWHIVTNGNEEAHQFSRLRNFSLTVYLLPMSITCGCWSGSFTSEKHVSGGHLPHHVPCVCLVIKQLHIIVVISTESEESAIAWQVSCKHEATALFSLVTQHNMASTSYRPRTVAAGCVAPFRFLEEHLLHWLVSGLKQCTPPPWSPIEEQETDVSAVRGLC